ncbi:MAG: hypothetical protein ACI92N_003654, partial [Pseudomonadales bacterium]
FNSGVNTPDFPRHYVYNVGLFQYGSCLFREQARLA